MGLPYIQGSCTLTKIDEILLSAISETDQRNF